MRASGSSGLDQKCSVCRKMHSQQDTNGCAPWRTHVKELRAGRAVCGWRLPLSPAGMQVPLSLDELKCGMQRASDVAGAVIQP